MALCAADRRNGATLSRLLHDHAEDWDAWTEPEKLRLLLCACSSAPKPVVEHILLLLHPSALDLGLCPSLGSAPLWQQCFWQAARRGRPRTLASLARALRQRPDLNELLTATLRMLGTLWRSWDRGQMAAVAQLQRHLHLPQPMLLALLMEGQQDSVRAQQQGLVCPPPFMPSLANAVAVPQAPPGRALVF
jgi:hypothetical protein